MSLCNSSRCLQYTWRSSSGMLFSFCYSERLGNWWSSWRPLFRLNNCNLDRKVEIADLTLIRFTSFPCSCKLTSLTLWNIWQISNVMLDVSSCITENRIGVLEEFNNCSKQWIETTQAVSLWQPPNLGVQQQTFRLFIIISAELSEESGIESMCLDYIYWCDNSAHWFMQSTT